MEPAETVLAWTDLAAAARRNAVRSWVWALLAPLSLFLLAMMFVFTGPAPRLFGVLLIGFFVSSPLWGPTMATWLQARRKTWPERPTRWVATSAGISVSTDVGESTLPWATLTKVVSWRKGVSLTYGRAVAFIPARAFRTTELLRAFVSDARSHIGVAAADPPNRSDLGRSPVPGDPQAGAVDGGE